MIELQGNTEGDGEIAGPDKDPVHARQRGDLLDLLQGFSGLTLRDDLAAFVADGHIGEGVFGPLVRAPAAGPGGTISAVAERRKLRGIHELTHLFDAADVRDDQAAGADIQHPQHVRPAGVADADIGQKTAVFRRKDHVRGRLDRETAVLGVDDDIIQPGTGQCLHGAAAAELKEGSKACLFHKNHLCLFPECAPNGRICQGYFSGV